MKSIAVASAVCRDEERTHITSMKNWIIQSIRAVVFADRDAFLWLQHKLGFTGYQMAALAWFKGIIIGLLLGWWLF